MVDVGFAMGINQLSLMLFTTAAPAGALAFAASSTVGFFMEKDDARKDRLRVFLIIPLIFTFLGLVASTNHLGKPANALFVLSGVGRSPLSNEVLATVIFASISWIWWLLGFSERLKIKRLRYLLPLVIVAALAEVWFTANAYSIDTIATWTLPFTQVNQISAACVGGCVIALFTMKCALKQLPHKTETRLIVAALVFGLVGLGAQIAQSITIFDLTSSISALSETFPYYPLFIALSNILVLGSLSVAFFLSRRSTQGLSLGTTILVLTCTLAGIALIRFAFYCTYLTVGIS